MTVARHFDFLPDAIKNLPRDPRGYPIPFFVAYPNGVADFRVADPAKFNRAIKEKRCWVCGGRLGRLKTFVLGPMCTITRVTAEPPCHTECAEFACRACPFLSKALAKRSDVSDIAHHNPGGVMIERNPGVTAMWQCEDFTIFHANGVLIQIGDPVALTFWREGRAATRDEVQESIRTGLPALVDIAMKQGLDAINELSATIQEYRTDILDRFMAREAV